MNLLCPFISKTPQQSTLWTFIVHNYKKMPTYPVNDKKYSDEELSEICEDAFVSVKEACIRLQERTKCPNNVVVEMLNSVADFYLSLDSKHDGG